MCSERKRKPITSKAAGEGLIATHLESGQAPTENVQRRLTELRRVIQALSEVIQKEALGPWMTQPNEAFDGLKPIEVIERGEVDRIWQMIYYVRSGLPF